MQKVKWYNHRAFSLILFLVIYLFCIGVVYDVDIWWHLAVGRYIFDTGSIPYIDIFSFTVPTFPYVYHSWLTDVIVYFLHTKLGLGLWGVTAYYALLLAGGFWFLAQTARKFIKNPGFIIAVLFFIRFGLVIINYRTQTITFLGLSCLVWFFTIHGSSLLPQINERLLEWMKRTRFWLFLPMYIIWVNLHGGFILGLGMVGILSLVTVYPRLRDLSVPTVLKYKAIWFFGIFLTLCALVVNINPYTVRVFWQAFIMVSNSAANIYSYDWMPLFSTVIIKNLPDFLLYGVVISLLTILVVMFSSIPFSYKLIISGLFLLTLGTRRYLMPLWIFVLPGLLVLIAQIGQKVGSQMKGIMAKLPLYLSLFIAGLLLLEHLVTTLEKTACANTNPSCYATFSEPINYPYQALLYLNEHGVSDHLLNDADWGGYLIWHFPQKRFFIDGRMDVFIVEGKPFLSDYIALIKADPNWQTLMEQYKIDSVLLSPEWKLVSILKADPNWQIQYEDEVSVYFTKI